ncbi:MAG: type II toxin-antitoxin system PemK/MazF family toxin [Anaerolineaceae bacterium]|nr:type II toxin-antitoxin system PemK/MazF family toxin [Anaerolineaceae bacterium]
MSRGEIYWVNFGPLNPDKDEKNLVGEEIRKTRPAVVVSPRSVGRPRLFIVVPLTTKSESYRDAQWVVPVSRTERNGLRETSWADASQVKSVSEKRFENRIGKLERKELEEIVEMIAHCVGHRPTRFA